MLSSGQSCEPPPAPIYFLVLWQTQSYILRLSYQQRDQQFDTKLSGQSYNIRQLAQGGHHHALVLLAFDGNHHAVVQLVFLFETQPSLLQGGISVTQCNQSDSM